MVYELEQNGRFRSDTERALGVDFQLMRNRTVRHFRRTTAVKATVCQLSCVFGRMLIVLTVDMHR
jgi:hypothetical protein